MSIKFTKTQIKEMILQETEALLLEANLTNARNLAKYLKNFANKIPDAAALRKIADDLAKLGIDSTSDIAVNSLKRYNADDLAQLSKNLQDIEKRLSNMDLTDAGQLARDSITKKIDDIQKRRVEIDRLQRNKKPGTPAEKKPRAPGDKAAKKARKADKKAKKAAGKKSKVDAEKPKVDAEKPAAGKEIPEPSKVTAKVAKGGDGVFRKLVAGTGLAALGLLMPKLSNMFKSAEAKDPDEEDVKKEVEKLDPKKVKKAAESAKQKRTRIAHSTIKAKNPKDSVIRLQARLGALGYDLGSFGVDGDYGGITLDAVRAFQKNNGLDTDGIVGRNTWSKLTSDDAKGATDASTGLPQSSDGSAAVTKMGSDVISKIEALDASDEKLRRVYERASRGLERALTSNGVPGRAANTTVRKFLPIIKPDAYGNDMETVKKQKIMRLQRVLEKGLPLAMGDRSVTIGQEVVIDIIEDALRKEQLMQESKSYDINFNKWSKLWE